MAENALAKVKEGLFSQKMKESLAKALPKHLPPERLLQISMTALTKNPKLGECTPVSIYKAVMESAQLGLVPDGILGEAYFVPYKNSCQLIAGYRGLQTLAVRSGKVSHIHADVVYSNDVFEYESGSFQRLVHKPCMTGDRGEFRAAYAVAHLIDNPTQPALVVMSADEIEKIKKCSRASGSGPWVDHVDEMRKKTVVRRLCKNLPMSAELVRAAVKGEYYEAGVLDAGKPNTSSWGFRKQGEPIPVEVEVEEAIKEAPEDFNFGANVMDDDIERAFGNE